MKKKKIREQTMNAAMEGMRAFVRLALKSGHQVSEEECFNHAIDNIIAFRNNEFQPWTRTPVTPEKRRAVVNDIGPLADEIRKECSEIVMHEGILAKTNTIQALSVEAEISSYLQEAGIKDYKMYRQKYRFKIFVQIGKKGCMSIPIRFNAVKEQLPKVAETIRQAEAMILTFGSDFKIW